MTDKTKKQIEQQGREIVTDEIRTEDKDLVRKWKRDLCHIKVEETENEVLERLLNNHPAP